MKYDRDKIRSLCDGNLSSREIASLVGCPPKYVQNMIAKEGLPKLPRGARKGNLNPSWVGGRIVDWDGYAVILDPASDRKSGRSFEHRVVMARKIGRPIEPQEVVDHIDGLHLHNCPSNLRLFASNADHLRVTKSGDMPRWSRSGLEAMNSTRTQRAKMKRVDSYSLRKGRGEIRMQQILLAWLSLEPTSPFLLGTHHLLKKAGIDWRSRPTLQRALDDLLSQWDAALER